MNKSEEELLKKKSLRISIAEGSGYSFMDGFGLRYITPYAVALGMSNFFIGILSSLPYLLGSLSELKGSKLIGKTSRKNIVITSVILQALMWLPIILIGYVYFFLNLKVFHASLFLILFYTLLILFGAFASPAWNSWMRDLISSNTDSYFGKRNGITGTVALLCSFAAGALLSYYKERVFTGFVIIFLVAFLGRSVSAYLFTKKYEPPAKKSEGSYFSFIEFVKKMFRNNFGMFVVFSTLMSFAVSVASPFFSVYLLKNLSFDYLSYTAVMSISIITTLISMPFWGKFGDKYGDVKIMKICGSFIFMIPLLWMATAFLSFNFEILIIYLIIIEIFSGIIWGGFGLSTGTFIFHAVTKERLPLCIAYSTILTSFGAFLGATLGGFLSSFDFEVLGLAPIIFVFLFSTILRTLFFFIFVNKFEEVRPVEKFNSQHFKLILARLWMRQIHGVAGVKRVGP